MGSFPFLSPEWIEQARLIRGEYRELVPSAAQAPSGGPLVTINLGVTEVPFEDEQLAAHICSGQGRFDIELGHVDEPDATVILDYATAQAILVEGNPQLGIQAYMSGRIRVEGDITKLMTMFSAPGADPLANEVGERLRAITTPAS